MSPEVAADGVRISKCQWSFADVPTLNLEAPWWPLQQRPV